ncbi:oxidoreductase [Kitasatospora camelliae]|uniref:Oxidoreductase n=1 Tax=Kitasatospora camelliae TaxID=3156397 RepID=A0AAU8K0C3_9ACTN
MRLTTPPAPAHPSLHPAPAHPSPHHASARPSPQPASASAHPSPPPTLAPEAVRRAALAAARDAEAADRDRRLTPEVVAALTAAGFDRHFVPVADGGRAGSFADLVEAVALVGEGCASAAWCAALYAAHGRLAGYLPGPARREIWGGGGPVRIAAAVTPPAVEAVATAGGWRLTGTWAPASGIDSADWVLLSAWAPQPDGTRDSRLFAVPAGEGTVLDTWHTLGMRGTGSHTLRLDGVDVPEHRTLSRERLAAAEPAEPGAARCHALPYPFVAALMFAAPVLGAARGLLADWTATAPPGSAEVLTRASAGIRAAGLLLDGAAGRADGDGITPLAVAENVRDSITATELCTEAADRLFRAAGSRAHATGDPLQRRWRDIRTAATHAMLRFDLAAQAYGRAVLGS